MPKKHLKLSSLVAAIAAIVVFVSGISGASATSMSTQSGAHIDIVGGQPATQSFTVSLQSIDANGVPHHECGGVLIARNWVLTAAHCAPFVTGQARVGSLNWKQGGEVAAVGHVFTNPDYNPSKGFGNDIALVELKTNVNTSPVSIGIFGPPNAAGLAQGWGLTCDTDLNSPACLAQRPELLQQLAMSPRQHRSLL